MLLAGQPPFLRSLALGHRSYALATNDRVPRLQPLAAVAGEPVALAPVSSGPGWWDAVVKTQVRPGGAGPGVGGASAEELCNLGVAAQMERHDDARAALLYEAAARRGLAESSAGGERPSRHFGTFRGRVPPMAILSVCGPASASGASAAQRPL